jgi:catechol 2,3-dioxygenase-like lactoylglutathione lyase family enzyme
MITNLYLVQLHVADWPAAVAWYRDVLGLPLALHDEANRFALFAIGTGRLALKEGTPTPGDVLVTFEVDDLDAMVQRLANAGVALDGAVKVSPEGYRRILLRDPDGHRLELFEWLRSEGRSAGDCDA